MHKVVIIYPGSIAPERIRALGQPTDRQWETRVFDGHYCMAEEHGRSAARELLQRVSTDDTTLGHDLTLITGPQTGFLANLTQPTRATQHSAFALRSCTTVEIPKVAAIEQWAKAHDEARRGDTCTRHEALLRAFLDHRGRHRNQLHFSQSQVRWLLAAFRYVLPGRHAARGSANWIRKHRIYSDPHGRINASTLRSKLLYLECANAVGGTEATAEVRRLTGWYTAGATGQCGISPDVAAALDIPGLACAVSAR